ncbi:restriction endonuclease subunit S [Draconibacterium sp. IB214405]|uniref:restriction endonuclease subunit S n=1 Tax=Draconibacterium sp. IB214405 TaxID=3097352 RepID=UPI002A12C49B|nr:restriction endonuclease subunit S [Draconibacterium sp. IB214405]MDX8339741.1 restriction endonuclease subunit S [Draconibacterium sp. IB214405]
MKSNKNLNVPNLRFPGFEGSWEVKNLDQLANIYDGTHQTPKYVSSGIPFVSVENIENIENSNKYISEDAFEKFKIKPQKDDILMTRITAGIIGATAIVRNNSPLGFYVSLALIRKKDDATNVNFLEKYINTNYFKHELHKRIIHIAFPKKINLGEIGYCKISFPDYFEQRKIAYLLNAIDSRISTQNKIIEDYKLLKKGMMQKIFNQELRFKDEHDNFYPEWKEKRLEEVCNLIKDGSHGTHKDDNSSFCFLLSAKNIIGNKVTFDSTDRKIPQIDYDSIYKNYQLLQGDILLTIVGTIGRVAIWKDTYPQIAFQRSVAILRFTKELPTFIAQLLNSDSFQKELLRKQVVSAQPGLYLGDIAKLRIKLPSIPEQYKIASALFSIDKKIELETEFLKMLETQKQHFLQNLFI